MKTKKKRKKKVPAKVEVLLNLLQDSNHHASITQQKQQKNLTLH
jgi:hypothetical protein